MECLAFNYKVKANWKKLAKQFVICLNHINLIQTR